MGQLSASEGFFILIVAGGYHSVVVGTWMAVGVAQHSSHSVGILKSLTTTLPLGMSQGATSMAEDFVVVHVNQGRALHHHFGGHHASYKLWASPTLQGAGRGVKFAAFPLSAAANRVSTHPRSFNGNLIPRHLSKMGDY